MLITQSLKKIRKQNNLTQRQVAKILHINLAMYKEYENGTHFPRLEQLCKLADYYNVSLPRLIANSRAKTLAHLKLKRPDNLYLWLYVFLWEKRKDVCSKEFASIESRANHIYIAFGRIPLNKINVFDINEFFVDLYEQKNLSHKTIEGVRNVFKGIFNIAIDRREYNYNPVLSSKVPKKARRREETQIITFATRKMIAEFPHKMQLPAMIMLYCGLRLGELLALTWGDISLKEKVINVNKSVEMRNGVPHLKHSTKTDAGKRLINIPNILLSFLICYVSEHPHITRDTLIIANANGDYCSDKTWMRNWNSYLLEMNAHYIDFCDYPADAKITELPMQIQRFTSKQLRHSYCTDLVSSHIDPSVTKRLAGHSSITVTLDYYTHLSQQHINKDFEKYNNYINCYYDDCI